MADYQIALPVAKKVHDLERLKKFINLRYPAYSERFWKVREQLFDKLESKYRVYRGFELFENKKPTNTYIRLLYAYRLSVSGTREGVFMKMLMMAN